MKIRWILALLLLPSWVMAESPVILVDARVAQYREAAAAARMALSGAVDVSPSAPDLASRLSDASVVVAVGQQALSAAQRLAPGKPIVYCLVLGSVSAGGRSVTGVQMEADPEVVFGHIRSLSPGARRVGLVYNAASSGSLAERASREAKGAGVELVAVSVGSAADVQRAVAQMAPRIDALWLPPDPKLFNREVFNYLLGMTSERKIPLIGFLDSFTEAGALASVSPDYADIGMRAGRLAADIAARAAAQRLPVPEPVYAPGKLTVNTRTAQALGLDISQTALSKARHVYR